MVRNYEKLVLQHIDSIENPMQQETIKRYVRYCKDQNQSIRTISGKVHTIKAIGAYYRDKAFEDLTKDYIEDYIDSDAFRCNSQPGRNEISQSTLGYYGINIRSFFKWVHFRGNAQVKKKGLYPECVDWMEIKQVQKITTPDQLFISILYDTGGRLGEILDITEDKVMPDKYGFTVILDGKTGPRPVRLFMSVPYLKQYMQTLVRGRYLIRTKNGRMSDTRAQRIVKDAAKAIGVERTVYPHLYRHGAATRLAGKLTESQLKHFAGWKPFIFIEYPQYV